MLPNLAIGFMDVSTYSLVYAVAIISAGLFAQGRVQALGVSWRTSLWLVVVTLVFAGLGARLGFSLGDALVGLAGGGRDASGPGQTVIGAVLLGGLAGFISCRRHGISPWSAADRFAPALPLGLAIGRLGCLAAGCCGGRPTDSWLGFHLPDHAGFWCSRYPVQIYSSLINVAIFLTLLYVERRLARRPRLDREAPRPGYVATLLFLLMGVKRFALDFLRLGHPSVAGVLTWPQVFGGAAALLAVAFWYFCLRRGPSQVESSAGRAGNTEGQGV